MTKKALAIDVGGTKIYSAIIDINGQIISDIEKNPTPKSFGEIKSLFEKIIEKYEKDVDVVAFSTCGAVNNENNHILGSTGNIAKGYPDMQFKDLSSKPVFVENDANCAAWAEYKIGASKGSKVSVMLTLGTGVGGGIIINNQLLKGQNG
ncbi:ROK family protein, partial [bacterium]|nr:ROK family protein [bacterium]